MDSQNLSTCWHTAGWEGGPLVLLQLHGGRTGGTKLLSATVPAIYRVQTEESSKPEYIYIYM